tara:strand:- start:7274 stop:7390 length:117 start_codon:yes stop_codon:yes gene_type:complete
MKNIIEKLQNLTYEQWGLIVSFILTVILLSIGIIERYA